MSCFPKQLPFNKFFNNSYRFPLDIKTVVLNTRIQSNTELYPTQDATNYESLNIKFSCLILFKKLLSLSKAF